VNHRNFQPSTKQLSTNSASLDLKFKLHFMGLKFLSHSLKTSVLLFSLVLSINAFSQSPYLVGYWHNWNDFNAPYLPLDEIDDRYNVVSLSFAIPVSGSDMHMVFVPEGFSESEFLAQIQSLQAAGKKVLLSVGGATASINLGTTEAKNDFVNSLSDILDLYQLDGLDIDIEHGASILAGGGTIENPASIAQQNLITAVGEIMDNYRVSQGQKLFLTFTPETAYVQGGQSGFGGIWGGYLPLIDALRDSIDILQVQLYNSGSMYGLDGAIYEQGNADFIVAMTEAVIQGFNTAGGFFEGLPAHKITVGLPACPLAAGGGYVAPDEVVEAVNYLMSNGPQPGSYSLVSNANGYPDLAGLMTWSINWDAVSDCGSTYEFADTFQQIFDISTGAAFIEDNTKQFQIFPNPANDFVQIRLDGIHSVPIPIFITDLSGRVVLSAAVQNNSSLSIKHLNPGMYLVQGLGISGKLVVN
jgi:chitinase